MKELKIQLRTSLWEKKVVRSIQSPLGERFGPEVKLHLPGQTVCVRAAGLFSMWSFEAGQQVATWSVVRERLQSAHADLGKLVSAGSSAAIPVFRAGRGPTEKSVKVRVDNVHRFESQSPEERERFCKSHTLTIPASVLEERAGQLYAPRWILMRTVHERVLDRKSWPWWIEGGVWLGGDDLWRDLWSPLESELELMESK